MGLRLRVSSGASCPAEHLGEVVERLSATTGIIERAGLGVARAWQEGSNGLCLRKCRRSGT